MSEFSLGIGDEESLTPLLKDEDFVIEEDGVLKQGAAQITQDMETYLSLESLRDRIQAYQGVNVSVALECLQLDRTIAIPSYLEYSNKLSDKHYSVTLESIEASMEGIWDKIKSAWNNIKAFVSDTFRDIEKVGKDLQGKLASLIAQYKEKGKKDKITLTFKSESDAALLASGTQSLADALAQLNDFYVSSIGRLRAKISVFNEAFDSPKDFNLQVGFTVFAYPKFENYRLKFKESREKDNLVVTFDPLIGGVQFIHNTGYNKDENSIDLRVVNVDTQSSPVKTPTVGTTTEISFKDLDILMRNLSAFSSNRKGAKLYSNWANQSGVMYKGMDLARRRDTNTSNAGQFIMAISARAGVFFNKEYKLLHNHYLKVMRAFIRMMEAGLK